MADVIFAAVLLWRVSEQNRVELALSRSFYGRQIMSELLTRVARHQFGRTLGSESKQQAFEGACFKSWGRLAEQEVGFMTPLLHQFGLCLAICEEVE